jgi:hypothetical protein
MKKFNVLALVLASLIGVATSGVAYAGPEVTITVKNNSEFAANYDAVSSSAYTYGQANPKPPVQIAPGSSDFFKVKGAVSPDLTAAIFQYKIGNKICKFKTSYFKTPGRNGTPKWSKSAEEVGGARCDVRVTAVNYSNHNWAVEFTMR